MNFFLALLLGALVGASAMALAENYFLIARQQKLFTYAEQLLGVGARLLALVPGKSAPRTDGADEVPRRWWQRLIPQPNPEPTPVPAETAPIQGLDLAGGARVRPAPADTPPADVVPQMDAADQALIRFGLRDAGGAS